MFVAGDLMLADSYYGTYFLIAMMQNHGHWAIDVSSNWRIVFKFEDGDACVVNYEDYH